MAYNAISESAGNKIRECVQAYGRSKLGLNSGKRDYPIPQVGGGGEIFTYQLLEQLSAYGSALAIKMDTSHVPWTTIADSEIDIKDAYLPSGQYGGPGAFVLVTTIDGDLKAFSTTCMNEEV